MPRVCLALAGALLLTCCGQDGPEPAPSPTPTPEVPLDVEGLLARMTLDEKIGQMTQADRGALSPESDIRDALLGSILSGGDSAPSDNTAQGWADMYDRFQSYALGTRLGVPLIYGVDAVHGHGHVRGTVVFPHNIGLGCTRHAALVEEVARVTAVEVAATGVDWTFSPCVAVARDERWGRTYESYGEAPDLVSEMGAAAVRGYQQSILACAKHYVGDGGTAGGRDQGDTQTDEAALRALHLPPYRAAVTAGVGSVMVSFSSWNGQKMHGQSYLITDVLKGELGFGGIVVSDWAGVDQLPGGYAAQVESAVNAGVDMVMVPLRYQDFGATLRSLVQGGRVPRARIDDAVRRILRQKTRLALFGQPRTDRSLLPLVGSAAHRDVARRAVRESLVLLKNEQRTLPLSKSLGRLLVAGKSANDLGNQCGGWTITWQGTSGAITTGTTILDAIRAAVSPQTVVSYSRDGSSSAPADAAIVVVGETPYAEGRGDRRDLGLEAEDLAAIEHARATTARTVVVLVSGRPMIIGEALTASDAFLAAWLPGTEGRGVTDVLFGDYAPTGKLSHSWPRSMAQVPINQGDARYDPLFAYGYGLTY